MKTDKSQNDLVIIGLGANLPTSTSTPLGTLEAALDELTRQGIQVIRRSSWYRSAPVPLSSQPWFINGVAALETSLDPGALLRFLAGIENKFERRRGNPHAARTLDLDLIDFRGIVRAADPPPELPHPRAHERAFVLLPLREVAPKWCHPLLGCPVAELIDGLPVDQEIERIR